MSIETGVDVPVSTEDTQSPIDDGASTGDGDDTAGQEGSTNFESKIGDKSTTGTETDGVIGPPLDDIDDDNDD